MAFPSYLKDRRRLLSLAAWLLLAACFAAWLAIFMPLVPANGVGLGGDYSLQLPNLLAGYFYFLTNGPLNVPWFNPAQCGGLPFIADLNVGYYTLPQWLAFLVDPVQAVRITFAVFAALQAIGAFLLARQRFATSVPAAFTFAVLLLFNTFYVYRVAIGHLTFHPAALAPWLAYLVLFADGTANRTVIAVKSVLATILVGAIFAYSFQAGMVHGIVPMAAATGVVILIHGYTKGYRWRPWILLIAGALLSVALSASRLTAAIAFISNFPRNFYPIAGFPNPLTALVYGLRVLFFWPPENGAGAMTNIMWGLERHEWEYSIGPAAALLIVAAVVVMLVRLRRRGLDRRKALRVLPVGVGIALGLLLPALLNWYSPGWNAFLREIPVISSSVTLLRWYMLDIPVAALLAALAVDRLVERDLIRVGLALAVAASVVGYNALSDKAFYRSQGYDGSLIEASWRSVKNAGDVPPVAEIQEQAPGIDKPTAAMSGTNLIALGYSQLHCYEPMFGYRLEAFDIGWLKPGPIVDQVGPDSLNMKNPACYLYPKENVCHPGSEFEVSRIADAGAFAAYKPFPFNVPVIQSVADVVNLVALVLSLVVLVCGAAALLIDRVLRALAAGRG